MVVYLLDEASRHSAIPASDMGKGRHVNSTKKGTKQLNKLKKEHNNDAKALHPQISVNSIDCRQYDITFRGSNLDELVVVVPGVLSMEECMIVDKCQVGLEAMGDDHDRQDTLSFAHEVWRVEKSLKECHFDIYKRLILKLMPSIDQFYWDILQCAHDDSGQIRLIDGCKRYKDKVLIRPEVERIVYDADKAIHTGAVLPHIGPHTDNSSAITMVCLLSNPTDFEGGTNLFHPERAGQPPREYQLKQGEAVLFRGECCTHWITPVTSGRRSILQIELAMCAGMHNEPLCGEQARARGRKNKGKSNR